MMKDRFSWTGVNARSGAVGFVAALVSLWGCLGVASPALAGEPTGELSDFRQCPVTEVTTCAYSQISGGETTFGKLRVPIVNPITFQFGVKEVSGGGGELSVFAALQETLAATPQPIPGGLSSLIDCRKIQGRGFSVWFKRGLCQALLRSPWSRTAYATMELAEPAGAIYVNLGNEIHESGVALKYAVKFHLENPLLGRGCYIGSDSEPIVFNFTTGATSPPPPNEPIHGIYGEEVGSDGGAVLEDIGKIRVDNAYSVPAVSGCGLIHGFHGPHGESLLDSLIDSTIGLPSPAGYNTAIQSGNSKITASATVAASEE